MNLKRIMTLLLVVLGFSLGHEAQGSYAQHTGRLLLPATPQVLLYDLDGNLTSDGRRGYDYDDTDQLIRVTETNSWKSEYTYDGKFRLRERKEYTISGGVTNLVSETRYIYDGMLVLQERDASNTPTITYARGRDLSGTMEGAGGIGGLLAMTDHSQTAASVATAYYHADANGNVTAMLNTNGIVVARYAYDPYGNTLAITGPRADANRYRFSSKEAQTRSGLYYYGRRFYAPEWQRWLNRDPIGEIGGLDLYGYVGNDPLNSVDPLGLDYSYVERGTIFGVNVPYGYVPYVAGDTRVEQIVANVNNIGSLAANAGLHTLNNLDIIRERIEDLFRSPGLFESLLPLVGEANFLRAMRGRARTPCLPAKNGADLKHLDDVIDEAARLENQWPQQMNALEESGQVLNMAKKADVKYIDYLQKKYKFGNDSRELLHEMTTKQNLSKKQIEEIARDLKGGK